MCATAAGSAKCSVQLQCVTVTMLQGVTFCTATQCCSKYFVRHQAAAADTYSKLAALEPPAGDCGSLLMHMPMLTASWDHLILLIDAVATSHCSWTGSLTFLAGHTGFGVVGTAELVHVASLKTLCLEDKTNTDCT